MTAATGSTTTTTRLTFRWRAGSEPCHAIGAAVRHGYDTREALLGALPQFSLSRLTLGMERLLAAGMAEIHFGRLTVSGDLRIVEVLAQGQPLDLPLDVASLDRITVLAVLARLGVRHPAGALDLLAYHHEEQEHED